MAIDTQNKRASVVGFVSAPTVAYPNPDGDLDVQADRQQMALTYAGVEAAVAEPEPCPNVGSWIESEVGDYVRGLNNDFDGSQIETWKNEAIAAALAGPPYPWYTPELKRWILDYFICIHPVTEFAIETQSEDAILTEDGDILEIEH